MENVFQEETISTDITPHPENVLGVGVLGSLDKIMDEEDKNETDKKGRKSC